MKRLFLGSLVLLVALIAVGCATFKPEPAPVEEETDHPDWLLKPPHEPGYFFGVGGDPILEKAKQKSLVNVGQQFTIHINSVLEERIVDKGEGIETVFLHIDEQVTDQVLYGAKYIDQYNDP